MRLPRFQPALIASIVAALFGLSLMAVAQATMPVTGTWLSADGGTKVRVSDCGGKLCGKVVWLNEPIDKATGQPKTDKRNADASKRARPLLGVQVVQGMKPDGDNKWSGQIYNADDGKVYQAHVTLVSDNAMRVQGCVLGILCKSQTWTRAD
ncbi:MAG: DUF2147 domain-containing protein [Proteobacteria bacterium]|nr:DUF2147 domain-containing protein [Pseudomonadota bacterium]